MLLPERLHAAGPVERKEHASLVGSPLIAGAAAYEIWRVHGATVPAVHHSLPEPGREADADWVNEQQRCVLLVALGGRPMAERQPPAVVVVKVERWGAEQSGTGAAEQTHVHGWREENTSHVMWREENASDDAVRWSVRG